MPRLTTSFEFFQQLKPTPVTIIVAITTMMRACQLRFIAPAQGLVHFVLYVFFLLCQLSSDFLKDALFTETNINTYAVS